MRDGKLWFPMLGGIAVVDPAAVPFNPAPPPVVIEECLLDRQPVAFQSGLQIRPGAQNLEINYTGLSLIKSEQLRFRYRLEGLDHDWVEAGTRRTAYYPHLPPGSYTFEVRAANSDGIWNTEGQRLRITVLPPFYRTWWFLTLATLLVGGVVFGVYKYRVTQLERRQAAQQAFARQLIESQESERKRIAAELHDSLGQSLVLIRNWALLGTSQLDKQAPAKEELDEITTTAARALNEVREIAYNLGPYHLDRLGLAGTIEDMVNRVAQASQIEFTTELTLPSGLLTREAEMHLYRITQEALNNLVKHSAAAAARVALQHDAHEVKLIVRDNGRGFDPHTSANHGKRGGFGLHGIEERVQLLGGVWTMQSAPGQGTTIEVTIGVKTV
jgi:signal transduction histidine kinase